MTEGATRPDPALQLLGATVRQYREQQRLSQRVLAAKTGIHHTYISEVELGRHNVSVLALLRLAHALKIPTASLLARLDTHATLVPPLACDPLHSRGAPDTVMTHDDTFSPQPGDPAILLPLLGATLRQYRQQRGLFQAALATMTGLSPTYIGEIERGERNISVLSLVRIADALELPVAHLLTPLDICQNPCPPLTD